MTKKKNESQQLIAEKLGKLQKFEISPNENSRQFIKITHYMLTHPNYIKLSSSAKIVWLYMRDWICKSEEYLQKGTFDFSINMIVRLGLMSQRTVVFALRELESVGFIQRENNAPRQSGITQKWSFSERWYTGEKRTY